MKVIKKEDYIEDLVIQIPLQQAIENNTIDAISLDKVKKAREKIYNAHMEMLSKHGWSNLLISLEILDKLIESEDKE